MNPVTTTCMMVVNLLFPRGCAGCDKPDEILCADCGRLLGGVISMPLDALEIGSWYACGAYQGNARRAILSWKDHGDEQCDKPFSQALAALAESSGVNEFIRRNVHRRGIVLVVPAPSSLTSMRRRGRRHMMPVARRLATSLERGAGRHVIACNALESRGVSSRSVQMRGTAQRTQRLKGRITVRSRVDVRGATVILVDDIVTSGATMRRCVDALRSAGANVVTVLALAHTPAGRPTQDDDHLS